MGTQGMNTDKEDPLPASDRVVKTKFEKVCQVAAAS